MRYVFIRAVLAIASLCMPSVRGSERSHERLGSMLTQTLPAVSFHGKRVTYAATGRCNIGDFKLERCYVLPWLHLQHYGICLPESGTQKSAVQKSAVQKSAVQKSAVRKIICQPNRSSQIPAECACLLTKKPSSLSCSEIPHLFSNFLLGQEDIAYVKRPPCGDIFSRLKVQRRAMNSRRSLSLDTLPDVIMIGSLSLRENSDLSCYTEISVGNYSDQKSQRYAYYLVSFLQSYQDEKKRCQLQYLMRDIEGMQVSLVGTSMSDPMAFFAYRLHTNTFSGKQVFNSKTSCDQLTDLYGLCYVRGALLMKTQALVSQIQCLAEANKSLSQEISSVQHQDFVKERSVLERFSEQVAKERLQVERDKRYWREQNVKFRDKETLFLNMQENMPLLEARTERLTRELDVARNRIGLLEANSLDTHNQLTEANEKIEELTRTQEGYLRSLSEKNSLIAGSHGQIRQLETALDDAGRHILELTRDEERKRMERARLNAYKKRSMMAFSAKIGLLSFAYFYAPERCRNLLIGASFLAEGWGIYGLRDIWALSSD